jgi:hypothetical protein
MSATCSFDVRRVEIDPGQRPGGRGGQVGAVTRIEIDAKDRMTPASACWGMPPRRRGRLR